MARFTEWTGVVMDTSNALRTERLVLVALSTYADGDGDASPGLATLAVDCRLGIREVGRVLVKLEELGELAITHGRGRKPNTYRILLGPNAPAGAEGAGVRNERTTGLDDLPDSLPDEPQPEALAAEEPPSWPYTITSDMAEAGTIDWDFLGPDLQSWFVREGYMPRDETEWWVCPGPSSRPMLHHTM